MKLPNTANKNMQKMFCYSFIFYYELKTIETSTSKKQNKY